MIKKDSKRTDEQQAMVDPREIVYAKFASIRDELRLLLRACRAVSISFVSRASNETKCYRLRYGFNETDLSKSNATLRRNNVINRTENARVCANTLAMRMKYLLNGHKKMKKREQRSILLDTRATIFHSKYLNTCF